MGGSALNVTETRRYAADEYHTLARQVVGELQARLPDARIAAVQAYAAKPDFGDLDVVVENLDAKQRLEPELASMGVTEVIRNGPVWSLGWGDFQVDLIFQSSHDFEFATRYFAFNDLGNLIGRTAHHMGFKFGHNGLRYVVRDGNNKLGELVLTKDFATALDFLGFDAARYAQGFQTLESVFTFAASSPYYDPQPFLLEHRSHRARVRDAKRPTYTAFLRYAEAFAADPAPQAGLGREAHLERAKTRFPTFADELATAEAMHARRKQVKVIFNGNLVAEATGLEGKLLGAFMCQLREDAATHGGDLDGWVLAATPEARSDWVRAQYRLFMARQAAAVTP